MIQANALSSYEPRSIRVAVQQPVQYELSGTSLLQASVRDLSCYGLFLESPRHFQPGRQVLLRFALPFETRAGSTRALIEALGEIRYRRRDAATSGVGIRFIRLSRESELLIRHFVDLGSARPVFADVELHPSR